MRLGFKNERLAEVEERIADLVAPLRRAAVSAVSALSVEPSAEAEGAGRNPGLEPTKVAPSALPRVPQLSIFNVLRAIWPQTGGPSFHSRVPETGAMISRETVPELTGRYAYETLHVPREGTSARFYNRAVAVSLDGQEVAEWPNSTAVRVGGREFVFPRAVRPFANGIDLEKRVFNSPENYVSDIPLMERLGDRTVYLRTMLRSRPGKVVFEDPRISTLHLGPGQDPIVLLSFTEYLPAEEKIRNRAVRLEVGADGSFAAPRIDRSGRPADVINLSPPGIDAKNGVLYMNDAGEVVLRTRMRGFDLCPNYAEQIWVFRSWDDFMAYQKSWDGWHEDLAEGMRSADGRIAAGSGDRVRPLRARIAVTEASLPEFYPDEALARREPGEARKNIHESPYYRGFGPGTRPVRLERSGDRLFLSEGPASPKHFAGTIPEGARAGFVIPDGEARVLTFDHQLRVLNLDVDGMKVPRRVYSATFKLWNAAADRVELIYGDAIQPVTPSCRGGGIPDLEHVYPEGWVEVPGAAASDPTRLALYCGVADASTERIVLDLPALLAEMSEGSPRLKEQVTPPLT